MNYTPALDRDRSADAALAVGAQVQQCWRNALMALLIVPGFDGWFYVEGVAVPDETHVPVEHGWIESPDGQTVIDPTLVLFLNQPIAYYAGVRYSEREARRLIARTLPAWAPGSLPHRQAHFGGMMHGLNPADPEHAAMIARCRELYRLDEPADEADLSAEGQAR